MACLRPAGLMAVGVLKEFEGEDVVLALKKVVSDTRDTNLRRNAIRGIVSAEANDVLRYVREVVEDEASYSDLDRLGLYEELLVRLGKRTGSKSIAGKNKARTIEFLKTHVSKESSLGNAIKLDRYLKAVDPAYAASTSRSKLLSKGSRSRVAKYKRYSEKELEALQ